MIKIKARNIAVHNKLKGKSTKDINYKPPFLPEAEKKSYKQNRTGLIKYCASGSDDTMYRIHPYGDIKLDLFWLIEDIRRFMTNDGTRAFKHNRLVIYSLHWQVFAVSLISGLFCL